MNRFFQFLDHPVVQRVGEHAKGVDGLFNKAMTLVREDTAELLESAPRLIVPEIIARLFPEGSQAQVMLNNVAGWLFGLEVVRKQNDDKDVPVSPEMKRHWRNTNAAAALGALLVGGGVYLAGRRGAAQAQRQFMADLRTQRAQEASAAAAQA